MATGLELFIWSKHVEQVRLTRAPLDPARELAADYSQRADAYARYWAPVIHATRVG